MMAHVALLGGAAASVALMLYVGRHNPSVLLMAMFVFWVASPFVAFWFVHGRASRRQPVLRPGLAAIAVAGGQLGLWLWARSEGGVLGPLDYLGETFGILVPLEFAFGVAAAWLAGR